MLISSSLGNQCKIPPIEMWIVSDGCLQPLWKDHYLKVKKEQFLLHVEGIISAARCVVISGPLIRAVQCS